MEDLTPRQIVAELDKYIVGQNAAKRAVAIALRNRYRRRLLSDDLRDEVIPKNILMIGPTGVGKTEIARRLATLAHAPFVKVEATKFTEVGYVGRDVDSMVRDLVQAALRLVEREKTEEVRDRAAERAIDRVVDILQPRKNERASRQTAGAGGESMFSALSQLFPFGSGATPGQTPTPRPAPAPEPEVDDETARKRVEQENRVRQHLREQIGSGARDEEAIDVEVEESAPTPFVQVVSPQNNDGGGNGMDMRDMLGSFLPKKRKKRSMTIAEAREHFTGEEARALIDQDQLTREAISRAEQTGIIFVDEMDKVAGRGGQNSGPDVSREGVQRDILPIIEGSTVQTKWGPVKTDHVLFIAAGAFHLSKPSDLIPELQGRLPIRVELDNLTKDDFKRILTEPRNALVRQYRELMATEGVAIEFTDDAVDEIANIAAEVNGQMENIGARRLHTVMERLLEDLSFDAPDVSEREVRIDSDYVQAKLGDIVKNEDLSRYIL